MNEKKPHITALFEKLVDGSISRLELDELMTYVRSAGSGSELKALMDGYWEELNEVDEHNILASGIEKRFEKILKKAQSGRIIQPVKTQKESLSTWKPIHWVGVAASILVALSIGLYWNMSSNRSIEIPMSNSLTYENFNGKQVVNLPDGSTVILNEDSQLAYADDFGQKDREVIFSGEGYFDITHDPDRPFVVHTDQVKTTVLGTAFNLSAYRDQSEVVVTVERGEVAVGDDKRNYDNILPKQQLVVNKQTRKFEKEEVDLGQVLAWKEKFLILDGVTVAKAAELIGGRHRVQITIASNEVKNCRINAAFMKGESLEQILRVVCGVLQADFTIDGDVVEITGGRKCT